MSEIGANLKIKLGKYSPSTAPEYIVSALESVQIIRSSDKPSVFQMTFHADRTGGFSNDYKLLSSPLLEAYNRVILSVSLNGSSTILMDGFILHQELSHDRRTGAATLTVTGEDISHAMDIYEYSLEYAIMGDALLAAIVIARYVGLGIIPDVQITAAGSVPLSWEVYPQQNSTDRAYLNVLAQQQGYIFYVKPGSSSMVNYAYWGPPERTGSVQKTLSVDMGPWTNVEKINFQYDATQPELVHGYIQDDVSELELPLFTIGSSRSPDFATEQPIYTAQPYVRNKQFQDPRLGYIRAADMAQADTDMSTDNVVTVNGEVDTFVYGSVIDAPGLIEVRGAGNTYDGKYYVKQVTHNLSRGIYKQQFVLTREGVGSTISEVSS